MNERIKELAIKAQLEHCVSHVRLEQFAELIIRECANIASINSHQYETSGEYVLKHFGVGVNKHDCN